MVIVANHAGHLADGWNVALFPQGSRGAADHLPFRLGVGHLLLQSGVAALPIGISGTRDAWPRGQKFPRRRAVRVHVGEPWKPDPRMSVREIVDELQLRVDALITGG